MTTSSQDHLPGPQHDDVQRALATARLHQESIQHADAKIARLAGLHGAIVTLVVTNMASGSTLSVTTTGGIAAHVAAIAFLGSLIAVARQLALGFRPETAGPTPPSRFGFSAPSLPPSPPAGDPGQRAEAWQLVHLLATIAVRKHQRVRVALWWSLLTTASAGAHLMIALVP